MSFLNRLRPGASHEATNDAQAPSTNEDSEIQQVDLRPSATNDDPEKVAPDQNAQHGVQQIEAVTLVWTKTSLATLLIWFVPPPYVLEHS